MTLSDKIIPNMRETKWDQDCEPLEWVNFPSIKVEDVKQFIKDLKDYEDLKIRLGNESKYLSEEEKEIHTTSCIDTKMEIDKLAGKELISDKEQKRKKE